MEVKQEIQDDVRYQKKLRRNYLLFHTAVGIFVVVCSFTYGLVAGFGKQAVPAHAAFSVSGNGPWEGAVGDEAGSSIDLPRGVVVVPMGRDTAINGRASQSVSFMSARKVRSLLSEQVKKWEAAGFYTFGVGDQRRGIALAEDKQSGRRFSMVAWVIPPSIRKVVSGGLPVQGIISTMDGSARPLVEEGEENGLVPGVPLIPGGKAGALFSSLEAGGRSYTGTYWNPGTVDDNIAYYRAEFMGSGWKEVDGEVGGAVSFRPGNLTLRKGEEEIVFLFSPARSMGEMKMEGGAKTLALVTRGPRTKEIPFR